MPELPEIEVIRRSLAESLVGRRLEVAELLRQGKTSMLGAGLLPQLAGQRLQAIDRHGKRLAYRFDDGLTLVTHLMLIGRVGFYEGARTVSSQAVLHLGFEGPWHVEVMFVAARDLAVLPTDLAAQYPPIAKLGPDALTVSAGDFAKQVLATRSTVKAALLDQAVVAGIGNAYADEILYGARMNPFTTVKMAGHAGVGEVYQAMAPTLRRAIDLRAGGEYLYGLGKTMGLAKKHDVMRVHNKAGEPCPTCGRPVTLVEKSGRGTFYCEQCQPERP